MSERKKPILLRRGPMSGEVQAIYAYTERDGIIRASGKQSVQADFDHIVLDLLMEDSPDICAALDGAARGMELNEDERQQIREFRARLVRVIERYNARLEATG